ncbi:MAG: hypothetical protein QG635_1465, partial [Bacteroidota bacterium]|nr:hypothetical protein [Bacteroidota bacterium]
MCGIAGIVDLASENPRIDFNTLKSMSDVVYHRGPDSDGQWISPSKKCGLAFRRLAIIDLSEAGNQPMTTLDGRYTIVFNGEIYNHQSIRQELSAKGYIYHSGTDTETILYGYIEYGKDIVQKLYGMWGFAIWDEEEKKLFAARDRIGIKPFYYSQQGSGIIFGSEIKSILKHPSVSKEFNIDELPNYLNFTMSSSRESLFSGINKLPAAHYLVFDKGGIKTERYWSPLSAYNLYSELNQEEIGTELVRLLRQSIKDRMMSDVPFGVFLSGGIDSSLNVALMSELMDRPVDTYTVGFKELEKYNELNYAHKISDLYKTNHKEILIDDRDALPILDELVWHEDEPNGDPVCIPLYFLSKLTRDSGTIVIQVGEGSDEEFVGYPWMLRDYKFYNSFWKPFASMPAFLRKGAYYAAKPALEKLSSYIPLEYLRRAAFGDEFYW